MIKEEYRQKGLQWKLDGNSAYKSEIVEHGGIYAIWFLEGYNDYGKYVMDKEFQK